MTDTRKLKTFQSSFLEESFTRFTHPCGCDIYVFPKSTSSTYAIFGSRYGSIHNIFKKEGDADFITVPDGIAHFLEHKLFTNEDGSDSFERFSEFGADANAYTSFNKTAYLFSCTDRFSDSLGELIDFVTHPYFTKESIESEIGIIAEEIKMYDDNPQDRCFYGMLEGMYHSHSIKRNICGSEKTISKITPKLLYSCYDLFYQPWNLCLIVCGNVSPEEVYKIADRHLPRFSKKTEVTLANENKNESSEANTPARDIEMQVSKPLFNIGFKDTDIPDSPYERLKKDAAMSILCEMLFSTSGELYNSLLNDGFISPAFSYGYSITDSFAYCSLAGEAADPYSVLEKIEEYIEQKKVSGLSEEDFKRGKRVMLADFIKNSDSSENIANNLFSFVCDSAEEHFLTFTDILSNTDFSEVERLLGDIFKKEYRTISIVRPNSKK